MSMVGYIRGRAYEYAWIKVLEKNLNKPNIFHNRVYGYNENAWNRLSNWKKGMYVKSCEAAFKVLVELEPRIMQENVYVRFLRDEVGTKGDARDIVVNGRDFEIGLSLKHNHNGVKSSRLSYKINFGKDWYGISVSKNYWRTIDPIFDYLWKCQRKGMKWTDIDDKYQRVYRPLLQAFIDEIECAYKKDESMVGRMVEYLIGVEDYYKIECVDASQEVNIYPFNLHHTLSKGSMTLPTKIEEIGFLPHRDNAVCIQFDKGWSFLFRIHSSSREVEPSLKLEVEFLNMPEEIEKITCRWI